MKPIPAQKAVSRYYQAVFVADEKRAGLQKEYLIKNARRATPGRILSRATIFRDRDAQIVFDYVA